VSSLSHYRQLILTVTRHTSSNSYSGGNFIYSELISEQAISSKYTTCEGDTQAVRDLVNTVLLHSIDTVDERLHSRCTQLLRLLQHLLIIISQGANLH